MEILFNFSNECQYAFGITVILNASLHCLEGQRKSLLNIFFSTLQ